MSSSGVKVPELFTAAKLSAAPDYSTVVLKFAASENACVGYVR